MIKISAALRIWSNERGKMLSRKIGLAEKGSCETLEDCRGAWCVLDFCKQISRLREHSKARVLPVHTCSIQTLNSKNGYPPYRCATVYPRPQEPYKAKAPKYPFFTYVPSASKTSVSRRGCSIEINSQALIFARHIRHPSTSLDVCL